MPGASLTDGRIQRVLEADPDLAAAIPEGERAVAQRALVVRSFTVGAGTWTLPPGLQKARGFGLLVRSGVIALRTRADGRSTLELLGAGDLLQPWLTAADGDTAAADWHVIETAELLVLDERFVGMAARWPSLGSVLVQRTGLRALRLSRRLAANASPRVDERILYVLAELAERWGKVTSRGVLIPLSLTHQQIAEMTSVQRQSVSAGMRRLCEQGRMSYTRNWLLLRNHATKRAQAGTSSRREPRPSPAG